MELSLGRSFGEVNIIFILKFRPQSFADAEKRAGKFPRARRSRMIGRVCAREFCRDGLHHWSVVCEHAQ